MFRLQDVLQLKDTEEVRWLTRRHAVTLFPSLFPAFLLIVLPFFFLFPLFSLGWPGVLAFSASILAGLGVAARSLLIWDADVFIVTNLRVVDVDQSGLFARKVTEAPLATVQDCSWQRKGILETVFRMGSVRVQTAGTAADLEAVRIPAPEAVHGIINDQRQGTRPKRPETGGAARSAKMREIQALLDSFSDEELARIETILRQRERQAAAESFLQAPEEAEEGKKFEEAEDEEAEEGDEGADVDGDDEASEEDEASKPKD